MPAKVDFDLKLPVKVWHCKPGTARALTRIVDADNRRVAQIPASKSSRHALICDIAQVLINHGELPKKSDVLDYCRAEKKFWKDVPAVKLDSVTKTDNKASARREGPSNSVTETDNKASARQSEGPSNSVACD